MEWWNGIVEWNTGKSDVWGCYVASFPGHPLALSTLYPKKVNKLQHKCSQLFLVQKNVLYNILKVSKNLMGGKYRILTQSHKNNYCHIILWQLSVSPLHIVVFLPLSECTMTPSVR